MAYALRVTEPAFSGFPAITRIVVFNKKSERDRCARFIFRNASQRDEFKHRNPGEIIPSGLHWHENTVADCISMNEAWELIGRREPDFESDGWCGAYNYEPCKVYESEVW